MTLVTSTMAVLSGNNLMNWSCSSRCQDIAQIAPFCLLPEWCSFEFSLASEPVCVINKFCGRENICGLYVSKLGFLILLSMHHRFFFLINAICLVIQWMTNLGLNCVHFKKSIFIQQWKLTNSWPHELDRIVLTLVYRVKVSQFII